MKKVVSIFLAWVLWILTYLFNVLFFRWSQLYTYTLDETVKVKCVFLFTVYFLAVGVLLAGIKKTRKVCVIGEVLGIDLIALLVLFLTVEGGRLGLAFWGALTYHNYLFSQIALLLLGCECLRYYEFLIRRKKAAQ